MCFSTISFLILDSSHSLSAFSALFLSFRSFDVQWPELHTECQSCLSHGWRHCDYHCFIFAFKIISNMEFAFFIIAAYFHWVTTTILWSLSQSITASSNSTNISVKQRFLPQGKSFYTYICLHIGRDPFTLHGRSVTKLIFLIRPLVLFCQFKNKSQGLPTELPTSSYKNKITSKQIFLSCKYRKVSIR